MKRLTIILLAFAGTLFLSSCSSTSSKTKYQVDISAEPSDGGTVTPTSGKYEEGKKLHLTATPVDSSWHFDRWSGDYKGTNSTGTVTVTNDMHIVAHFSKKKFKLTVHTKGKGTVEQKEINVSSASNYKVGTVVELTAKPNTGWKFVKWTGDLSGSKNPIQITVKNPKEVTAVFKESGYPVTIKLDGKGKVKKDVVSGTKLSSGYSQGSKVKITVIPDNGWNFVYWKGDLSGTDNPKTITVKDPVQATASLDKSPFGGGNGSKKYPYQISTLRQLQAINNYTKDHFIQINDINANATKNWNGGKGFKPIGDDILPFSGTFNGQGYKITDLIINNERDHIGLFGETFKSNLKNIVLKKVNINGGYYSDIGALAGTFSGEIDSCYVSGKVVGGYAVGGMIGENYGRILNSKVSVQVSGNGSYIGGLVGDFTSETGYISNSQSFGRISGNSDVGGLIGLIEEGSVINSYADINVNGKNKVGGLVGELLDDITISNSYSKGSVSGIKSIGGLIGYNNFGIITASYSLSDVKGKKIVGGLIAVNRGGKVKQTYAIGSVSGITNIGGLIGENGGKISSSYWDIGTTNQSDGVGHGSSDGVTGLKKSQMTGQAAKKNMRDFDFKKIWVTTNSYPILQWQK